MATVTNETCSNLFTAAVKRTLFFTPAKIVS